MISLLSYIKPYPRLSCGIQVAFFSTTAPAEGSSRKSRWPNRSPYFKLRRASAKCRPAVMARAASSMHPTIASKFAPRSTALIRMDSGIPSTFINLMLTLSARSAWPIGRHPAGSLNYHRPSQESAPHRQFAPTGRDHPFEIQSVRMICHTFLR